MTVCPVAHDVHGGFAVNQQLGGGSPSERVAVGVRIREIFLERVERVRNFFALPRSLARPKSRIFFRAHRAGENCFKRVLQFKTVLAAQRDGLNARGFEFIGGGKEFIPCGWRRGDARFFKQGFVVPQHIRAMDIDRHAPVVVFEFQHVEERRRKDRFEFVARIHIVHVHDERSGVISIRFPTRVQLERIGRDAAEQLRKQLTFEIGACAAGDGGVDDFDIGIRRFELLEHFIQTGEFAAVGPPRRDNELTFGAFTEQHRNARGRIRAGEFGEERFGIVRARNTKFPTGFDEVGIFDVGKRRILFVF